LRRMLAIAATGVMVTATLAACGGNSDSDNDRAGDARVGVILPDTKNAAYFKAAFAAARVPAEIRSSGGDPAEFERIGNEMIGGGVRVLIVTSVDSASGKAVLDKAGREKIPTIDFDRLTVDGGADYFVSFDSERIGELQGYGLTRCLQQKKMSNPMVAELNGAPDDSNATFSKNGYDRILQPRFDSSEYRKGPDQFVPGWSGDQAHQVFQQMLDQQPRINAVLAANDDLAAAVIKILRKKGLNGKVPVTGQDATVEGLRNVLTGDQCMTIYKRTEPEAYTAANLAVKLLKGEQPTVGDQIKDPVSGAELPYAKLPPISIEASDVKDVVADGYVSKKELCTGIYLALCNRYGVK
jgi:D-xylose transport system substrate-binding protein